jgi:RND family efflux transporter MFP subunit
VEREARFAEVDAALAARSRDAAAVRRDLARVDAERRARDAAEDLEKLRRDRAKLEMRAPRAGIVTHAELEPGATVAARQVLFEVLEPDTHVAKAAVPAADLRTVLDGVVAKVRLESLGGVEVTGELVEVGWTASEKDAAGDGKYAIRLRLPVEPSPLRPGMKVRVLLEGNAPLQGVLSIPRKAVFAKDGRSVAFVPSEGGPGERALVVGRGNPDRVEIVSGLAEGDEVLLERPAGK